MITVKALLAASGLTTPESEIRLVRHSDHLGRSIRRIVADGLFEIYQSEQSSSVRPFHNCSVIVSFIGTEGNRAEFHGIYEVLGHRPFKKEDFANAPDYLSDAHRMDTRERIWYILKELAEFRPLRGRLIAQWVSTRGWFQTKDLLVSELLPPGRVASFPGYQNVILSWKNLQLIFSSPESHRDWKTALQFTSAIYRIVDLSTGRIYIGSAYGKNGLWNRWNDYAKTGHGNNKLLMPLEPSNFQWSIVRTLSGVISERDVILLEQIEKEKHGSRAQGLNGN